MNDFLFGIESLKWYEFQVTQTIEDLYDQYTTQTMIRDANHIHFVALIGKWTITHPPSYRPFLKT